MSSADLLHPKQTAVVPCGVEDCSLPARRNEAFDQSAEHIILFAGILCEAKGVLTLLHACGILKSGGRRFRVKLMGAFQSEAFRAEAEDVVRQCGLSDCAEFCGVLTGKEKQQAFHEASVFCFPSHYPAETFGVVLIEAMSHSLPIVATDWQGIPEVTGREGLGAILVPVQQPAVLAGALDEVLASGTTMQTMGAYNRQRYLDRFTLSRYREGLANCLSELQST